MSYAKIDLHGMEPDSAVSFLKKSILDLYEKGEPGALIIHGRGEGLLRSRVHDALKYLRFIESARYGTVKEGGAGVTVVVFRE